MSKNVSINVWDKEHVCMLDVEKLKERKILSEPKEDAAQWAKLIMNHMRGDTLEIILAAIEEEIKNMVRNNPSFLLECYDISNRVRGVLCQLENGG